ncbi:MAG: NUDIX domain-containing protein [Pontixanthobacter sp.]
MFQLIPAPLHRALMPLAYRLRRRWRLWRRTPIAGCTIIATDLQGQLLLMRHSYGPKVWALPGGGLKQGEDPAEAARREMREETGCGVSSLALIGILEEEISGSSHTAYVFSARIDQMPVPDLREVVEARLFPTHSLPEPLGNLTRRRLELWRETLQQR